MAVPNSGTLSMLKMAREAKHADYNGSQSMGTISLYDLVNGGQANGSTVSYPAVNQGCTPNPATRGSLQLTAVRDDMGSNSGVTLYYSAGIGNASNLQVGHILYSNSNLTTPVDLLCGLQTGETGNSTRICNTGDVAGCIDTDSSGVITNLGAC